MYSPFMVSALWFRAALTASSRSGRPDGYFVARGGPGFDGISKAQSSSSTFSNSSCAGEAHPAFCVDAGDGNIVFREDLGAFAPNLPTDALVSTAWARQGSS